MAKSNAKQAFGISANRFQNPENLEPDRCSWFGCHALKHETLGVCFDHAMSIYTQMDAAIFKRLDEFGHPKPGPAPVSQIIQPFVYYLLLNPTTVKIGTTKDLRQRIGNLRTDIQYVAAIELGDRKVEYQRHKQFAEERYGRREDFRLSERLKKHIESLQPQRDELVALACEPGGYRRTA